MVIGIIGAMIEEVEPLLNELKLDRKLVKAEMEFNLGDLWGKKVVIVKSGIAKVNAAICAQILIDDFNVDVVINVGVAGGVGLDVYPGDVVIADSLVQHDIDATAFGEKKGQIPRMDTFDFKCDETLVLKAKRACEKITHCKCFIGRIVTGDQFIADPEKIKWLNEEFNALACEMEGGSIAQVCYLNSVPFVIIRSASDNANNGAHMEYEEFKPVAVKNSVKILENMLKTM
ncbi:adenosylhomocysteine nucleosidase [Clostridium tetanomorphum]|uniref:adenosylhomocysteine nucleosidase n=1 Tax=Clostridium tetanomorphum TaxID=1553 RepID=A0A923J0D1_CLOTT|nr:5'-methylthioadenosine/adenosylhomocysteine nucleosidase [Clostridium tetanomorphum]KAJ53403.1 5'-methylthioadenosine/S-adenosylhomocysteine nucleosidase [Clostridium tetanomorphum DSM 665]MBC2396610.1 5'-methylthioadenosine/adenosylhomocysteine nucleosidase [Clostridium tetanomorphum]MBP1863940.1 adenosylhomocysteine nucleosidase [Clostridium tetanomorphum]NRS85018.1 adenosylhomocysteine nucleosidase [Clostridium tetanomorphum]NRZ98234.1 adenosylhomocysteine nucleosidase [Clostridium tetan